MTAMQSVVPVVLTAPGGRWEIDGELRQKLCLTDDQILHVVDGYGGDPYVLAFYERVKRSGGTLEWNWVTPEALRQMYQGVPVESHETTHYQYSANQQSSTGKQDLVKKILRDATAAGASDIHFFATPHGHQLRARIHGQLETIQSFAGQDGTQLLSTIYETMSESTSTSYRPGEKQDGRLRSEFVTECGLFGARLATRPTLNGPWMAMRLLYDSGKELTLEDMGYLPEQIEALLRLIHRVDGIVLLTGTTGAGKSTTIQTLLNLLLKGMGYSVNLVTVEDPVEYRIHGANQTPLGPKESWAEAISNMMRLDPDVGFIGEMRDIASALAAFQAALTGHMMWSTLHVNSAAASLQRLHDLGVDDNLVYDPGLMKGLVNQSLTRVLCSNCKVPYLEQRMKMPEDLRRRVERHCIAEQVYVHGEGCQQCHGRGITGRTAIAEILLPDISFMRRFRDQGRAEAQAFWVQDQGGITKNAHLLRRVSEGLIDPRHAERDVCPLDEDVSVLGG